MLFYGTGIAGFALPFPLHLVELALVLSVLLLQVTYLLNNNFSFLELHTGPIELPLENIVPHLLVLACKGRVDELDPKFLQRHLLDVVGHIRQALLYQVLYAKLFLQSVDMYLVYRELLSDVSHLLFCIFLLSVTVSSISHHLMKQLLFLRELLGQELPAIFLVKEVIHTSLFANEGFALPLKVLHCFFVHGQSHLFADEKQELLRWFA